MPISAYKLNTSIIKSAVPCTSSGKHNILGVSGMKPSEWIQNVGQQNLKRILYPYRKSTQRPVRIYVRDIVHCELFKRRKLSERVKKSQKIGGLNPGPSKY